MSRFHLVLSLTVFLTMTLPAAGHGGGGGHGGHGGYGYGGHGGYGHGGHGGYGFGGHHGFGYGGFGYPGFGFSGFGFNGFGFSGFGFNGFGLGGFGLGGYGGFGLGGYGGLGYGGYGYGGLGYGGGYGYRGYGGYSFRGYGYGGGCSPCCCGMLYPAGIGGSYSAPGAVGMPPTAVAPALAPNGYSLRPRYLDYYAARTAPRTPSTLTASNGGYADYYARIGTPVTPPANSDTTFYRTAARMTDNKAHLHVLLPADAKLWLNGRPTTSLGAEREFISPELEADATYVYEIKVRWLRDGRTAEQTKQVHVRANQTTTLHFQALPANDDGGSRRAVVLEESRSAQMSGR